MMKNSANNWIVSGCRRGFTLVEILVVLVIITILLGLALPALRNMLDSQDRIAAESRLGTAVRSARDTALAQGTGQDVAAVFTYDLAIEGGARLRILQCRFVGVYADPGGNGRTAATYDVFVPVSGVEPVSLPRGWTVRGYVPSSVLSAVASNSARPSWYSSQRYDINQPAWVFPETGFFDHTVLNDGENRQTFMVRFEGGTGTLQVASTRSSLVLLPKPSALARTGTDWTRVDQTDDIEVWARRMIAAAALNPGPDAFDDLIGPDSSDVVLTRGVSVLGLSDEQKLADALGVRTDGISDTIMRVDRDDYENNLALRPAIVQAIGEDQPGTTLMSRRWLEGYRDLKNATATQRADLVESRLFSVDRYLGNLLPVWNPTQADLQGIR
jgi:prepilin-type N-terminal cleavage/methylation domain-containing protein